MLTAKVYDAVKSDIDYTRDTVVRYIKAKEMILEYLDKMRKESLIEIVKAGKKSKYVRVDSSFNSKETRKYEYDDNIRYFLTVYKLKVTICDFKFGG